MDALKRPMLGGQQQGTPVPGATTAFCSRFTREELEAMLQEKYLLPDLQESFARRQRFLTALQQEQQQQPAMHVRSLVAEWQPMLQESPGLGQLCKDYYHAVRPPLTGGSKTKGKMRRKRIPRAPAASSGPPGFRTGAGRGPASSRHPSTSNTLPPSTSQHGTLVGSRMPSISDLEGHGSTGRARAQGSASGHPAWGQGSRAPSKGSIAGSRMSLTGSVSHRGSSLQPLYPPPGGSYTQDGPQARRPLYKAHPTAALPHGHAGTSSAHPAHTSIRMEGGFRLGGGGGAEGRTSSTLSLKSSRRPHRPKVWRLVGQALADTPQRAQERKEVAEVLEAMDRHHLALPRRVVEGGLLTPEDVLHKHRALRSLFAHSGRAGHGVPRVAELAETWTKRQRQAKGGAKASGASSSKRSKARLRINAKNMLIGPMCRQSSDGGLAGEEEGAQAASVPSTRSSASSASSARARARARSQGAETIPTKAQVGTWWTEAEFTQLMERLRLARGSGWRRRSLSAGPELEGAATRASRFLLPGPLRHEVEGGRRSGVERQERQHFALGANSPEVVILFPWASSDPRAAASLTKGPLLSMPSHSGEPEDQGTAISSSLAPLPKVKSSAPSGEFGLADHRTTRAGGRVRSSSLTLPRRRNLQQPTPGSEREHHRVGEEGLASEGHHRIAWNMANSATTSTAQSVASASVPAAQYLQLRIQYFNY